VLLITLSIIFRGNQKISVFYKVRNIKNLKIEFGLRNSWAHNVACINLVHFLYIMLKSKETAILLVVIIIIPLLLKYIKSAETSDLTPFSNLLILKMCILDFTIILFCIV